MKKEKITKRQHYIQRAYLCEWTDNKTNEGFLFAHRKSENKTFPTSLMGVGQEAYFYEMKRLSEVELVYCILCGKSNIDIIMKNKPYFYLEMNQAIWRLEDKIINISKQKKIDLIKKEINNIQKQLGEEIQSKHEGRNIIYIKNIINGDYSFYKDDDKRVEFLFYLAMQYVRTKNIRESLITNFKKIDEFIDKIKANIVPVAEFAKIHNVNINVEMAKEQIKDTAVNFNLEKTMVYNSLSAANELAHGLIVANKMSLGVLQTPDELKFITGDQPIINLKLHERDEKGNILDMEFYYPLSPQVAILLKKDKEPTVYNKTLSSDEVDYYNNFIFDNSYEQVYASSEVELLTLCNR